MYSIDTADIYSTYDRATCYDSFGRHTTSIALKFLLSQRPQRFLNFTIDLLSVPDHGTAPVQIQIRHRYTQDGVLQEELEQQLKLRLEAEGELSSARELVTGVEQKLRDAEQERAAIEQRAEKVRGDLERQRIASQSIQFLDQRVGHGVASG